jgi:DNA-binding transcriptional regulator YbjK
MASRAQLTQERSRLRRDELLTAAIELFAQGGARAITHRAVAARAGLPPATTTYYFASIDELIREALGAHITRWSAELDALASVDISADVSLDAATEHLSSVFAQRGPEVAALKLSIFLAAAREPQLHDVAGAALRSLERLAIAILTKLGVGDSEEIAAGVVALIAGTALRRQSGVYSEREEARFLTASIRNLVAAHAIGPDEVSRALTGLTRATAEPA